MKWLYLIAHQVALVADIITVVIENIDRNSMTYSAKIPKTFENFSEVAIHFRLLQDLCQRQDQVSGDGQQTLCTFG